MTNFTQGWYVVYTKPRHEKKIVKALCEQEIENFFPLQKVVRIWHDRKKIVEEPLFSSYLFVFLQNLTDYFKVSNIESVLYFVKTGKVMALISADIIQSIKAGLADKDIIVSDTKFPIGSRIQIHKGPFTGIECEVIEHEKKNKIIVRLEMLSRNLIFNLKEDLLLPV